MKFNSLLRQSLTAFIATCLLVTPLSGSIASGQIALTKIVIAGGGTNSVSGGTLGVNGTIGQSAAGGPVNGANYQHGAGFWDDPSPSLGSTTFIVTKTADTADGVCNSDCSFREAIIAANANSGPDSITFQIGSGPQTIQPTSLLPTITDPVVINATTQPGFSGSPLIEIDGTIAGEVGGITITAGNSTLRGLVINGFRFTGLQIFGNGNNLIAGNYIGLNLDGTAAKSTTRNNGVGVIVSSPNNVIGGTTAADRNVIAGNKNSNGSSGLWLQSATATGNKVIGNYIGTDKTGAVAIPHQNHGVGIFTGASNNTIGGLTLERNIIVGGNWNGISITDSSNNKVQRNLIGMSPQLAPLSNGVGIVLSGISTGNLIGGPNTGDGNLIANSINQAIWVQSNLSTGNSILGNSIFNNGFGIDLGAGFTTPNDTNDPDIGPNNQQNFPLITSVTPGQGSSQIGGTLNSNNGQFRIEVFSNPSCHVTGNGEGKGYLGSTTVTVAGNNANFNFSVPFDVSGSVLTATATDAAGNTSEFSPCFAVAAPANSVQFVPTSTIAEGGVVNLTVKRTGSSGAVSVNYETANETAIAGDDYAAKSGSLSWANGDSSDRTIQVITVADTIDENTETFKVLLSNPVGISLGNPSTVSIQVLDDDPPPILSIANKSQAEGNSGTTTFNFAVSMNSVSGRSVSFNYSTGIGGSATAGDDYQATSGVITIPANEAIAFVSVSVKGDMDQEPDEVFTVNLSNPVNATLGNASADGTILNDDNVAPTTFGFQLPNVNVQEDLGAVTITVLRLGDSTTEASIEYFTNDGTATQKGDFEYASGRLKFAIGETQKTFVLLINEDTFSEGSETIKLQLNHAVGGSLGPQSSATITITDDAPEGSGNPIDNAQSFVYMHYHDFLNREPDPGGLAFWTNEITMCGLGVQCIDTKRTNVSAAFFLSIEFQETGYLVYKTHKAAYGNLPGAPVPVRMADFFADTQEIGRGVVVGAQGWEQALTINKFAFMSDFVKKTKFRTAFPTTLHPTLFVDQLFANAGVVPTTAQRNAAIAQFGSDTVTTDETARALVLGQVAGNPALSQQEFNKAFVLMQYFGYLRRNPNDAPDANYDGFNFWLNKLNQFNGSYVDAEMVRAFIQSIEYRQRFAP